MNTPKIFWLALPIVFLLTGCPSDGGNGGGGGAEGGGSAIVYLADQTTPGVFELFLVSSGAKLNPPLQSNRTVTNFSLTPDKTAVVYIADQNNDNVFELFLVNLATPGNSVKLNGVLQPNGDVVSFAITPDGTSVVYLADQTIDPGNELFQVFFANTGSGGIRLTPTFATGGTVSQFAVTPDSTRVVYLADADTLNVKELYQVAFLNPRNPAKLNTPLGSLAGNRNVRDFAVSPNGASIVYLADQDNDNVFELYLAQVSPATASGTRLNPALQAGQNVTTFAITPDSAAVIYRANADETTPGIFPFQLYRVFFASPAPTTNPPLNGVLVDGGNVSTAFSIAPDGSAVVYRADQRALGVQELFRVALTSPPGASQQLNLNLAGGQNVTDFAITPDSAAVIYMANQTSGAIQLYRVVFSAPQMPNPPVVLNGALGNGGNVRSFAITPTSTVVIYLADQIFGTVELFSVNVGAPGESTKLNGQLVAGGNVAAFTF